MHKGTRRAAHVVPHKHRCTHMRIHTMHFLPVYLLVVLSSAAVIDKGGPLVGRTDNTSGNSHVDSYAPVSVACPDGIQWVRSSAGLSDEESTWVKGRKTQALPSFTAYLERLNLVDFDVATYVSRLRQNEAYVPALGTAISGGAWASSLTGTGALRALDDRFSPAVQQRTGGLLQSLTYLAGLSGGSWPVMSLVLNNNPPVDAMVHSWNVNVSRFDADEDTPVAATIETMIKQVYAKFQAGYKVSYSDFFGRAFAYEFVPGTEGGLTTLFSDLTKSSSFKDHSIPFPLFEAGMLSSGDQSFYNITAPSAYNTVYEWSPFEFGTWQGFPQFFPTKYLGTKMSNGAPLKDCVIGFDSAGYMLAIAADATNYWWLEGLSNDTLGSFDKRDTQSLRRDGSKLRTRATSEPTLLLSSLEVLEEAYQKVFNLSRSEAMYATVPNPFASSDAENNTNSGYADLSLVDQSEMFSALPLVSLAQPARQLDMILTWDNDEDSHPYNWINGTDLYGAYQYAQRNEIPFPIVPEPATFVNRGYFLHPTFFGCEANLTTTNTTDSPIIVYLGNAPYSSYTNYSGFQMAYSNENMAAILTNSFNIVTQGNSTLDSEWPECLGCATIDRSRAKVGMVRSQQCERCFRKYCWDGVSQNDNPGIVDPALVLDPSIGFAEWNRTSSPDGTYWAEVE